MSLHCHRVLCKQAPLLCVRLLQVEAYCQKMPGCSALQDRFRYGTCTGMQYTYATHQVYTAQGPFSDDLYQACHSAPMHDRRQHAHAACSVW